MSHFTKKNQSIYFLMLSFSYLEMLKAMKQIFCIVNILIQN